MCTVFFFYLLEKIWWRKERETGLLLGDGSRTTGPFFYSRVCLCWFSKIRSRLSLSENNYRVEKGRCFFLCLCPDPCDLIARPKKILSFFFFFKCLNGRWPAWRHTHTLPGRCWQTIAVCTWRSFWGVQKRQTAELLARGRIARMWIHFLPVCNSRRGNRNFSHLWTLCISSSYLPELTSSFSPLHLQCPIFLAGHDH